MNSRDSGLATMGYPTSDDPLVASTSSAACHSLRTGSSSIHLRYSGSLATDGRGGAIPWSAIFFCTSGLVAHCTKYQAASGCLLCEDTAMPQPIVVGTWPASPAGNGS